MKVSVILPNYNHASFLRQRINSILDQSFQDFELILLDDCSTDNSQSILEEYHDNHHVSHILFNEVNGGSPFKQWDKGIALAQGQWIWIAESDDWAESSFLRRMIDEVEKVPDCSLAYANTWWVDEKGKKLWETPGSNNVVVYSSREFIKSKLSICNSIANVSECIFRRDKYRPEENERYEWMRLCGDWFFYVLLAERGNVVEVEQPLSYYRQHGGNISETSEHKGLTFLEGVNVLEYMITHNKLKSADYAKGWGRMWTTYEKQYKFTPEVKSMVKRRMNQHPEIVLWYHLYKMKSCLR